MARPIRFFSQPLRTLPAVLLPAIQFTLIRVEKTGNLPSTRVWRDSRRDFCGHRPVRIHDVTSRDDPNIFFALHFFVVNNHFPLDKIIRLL
jgi:hypothetical protein